MRAWHEQSADAAMKTLGSRPEGLREEEVAARRVKHGSNELPHTPPAPWWMFLLRQFMSPLIIVLGIAALLSVALRDWIDVGVIAAAILLNTAVGFAQEWKANRALERLRSYVQPSAIVRREGRERAVPARDIVPGDVLVLSSGDRVAADARLFETAELEINESALTGESLPIVKHVEPLPVGVSLSERRNMAYAGTVVVAGRAFAVVTETGLHTELGTVAALVNSTEETATPLQIELQRLARWISGSILVIVVVLFAAGVTVGRDVFEMFETSVALAVAAIPEGLMVSVTVILAVGMQRILKRRALTRRLLAAETLGSVTVICTDKTGTITEGQMRVSEIATEKGVADVSVLANASAAEEVVQILESVMLCNDAAVSGERGMGTTEVSGSPTERALMDAGLQAGISLQDLRREYPRLEEIPFDSTKKYMVTVHRRGERGYDVLLKGAPEKILPLCKISVAQRGRLEQLVVHMAERGLRVIAVARERGVGHVPDIHSALPTEVELLGFVGLRDPLRSEAREQIRAAREAGVRTVLITGDHPKTAHAIAQEAGLADGKESVVTGPELDQWDDAEFARRVESIRVYARVEPRHKIRIVRAWQSRGEVVAMTGDGVNDAPALKAADIGIALGSGTEVAKEVADLVLLDNNLATITAAIEEGRVIFDNLRKSVAYLMTSSFTEIVLIAGSLLVGLPLPLLSVQILWINLVTDTFPNVALTLEPGEPGIMRTPPRRRGEPVLNRPLLALILLIGLVTDTILFGVFVLFTEAYADTAYVQSLMFAGVGIASLVYVFAIKSFRRPLWRINPLSNPWLLLGVGAGFLLLVLAFTLPVLQTILQTRPIPLSMWGLLLMIGAIKLVAIECAKMPFWAKQT